MSAPKVTSVAVGSPAARAGFEVGDELLSINGTKPTDVIEYHQLTDGDEVEVVVRRTAPAPAPTPPPAPTQTEHHLTVRKDAGEPMGIEVSSAVFDRIRTCDNHCSFCFIYQLPKGMRRSLYLKDDDYRLSFLYGNFTTLTRFTELDLERVIDEKLSPLFVSIHATDPERRAAMLRNPRGATSLRWLQELLKAGIEIHGQVVVCPGVNDGAVLEQTMMDILDEYPALSSVGVVPLGLSRFADEPEMRPHTVAEAAAVCDTVDRFQGIFHSVLGRRLVHAADEYYLMAGRPMPPLDAYDGFPQHENGIGMLRAFEAAFEGDRGAARGTRHGFFASVDGAPAVGYRAPRWVSGGEAGSPSAAGPDAPPVVLTGTYAAHALVPLLERHGFGRTRVLGVENRHFGGNVGVAGLLVGGDLARVLAAEPAGARYLLPDACLSQGRFLDGLTPADLPCPVEVVPTDGASLRRALVGERFPIGAPTAAPTPVPVPVPLAAPVAAPALSLR